MSDITPAVEDVYLKVYRAKGYVPVNPWKSGSLISDIYTIQLLSYYDLTIEFLRCIIMKNIQLTVQNCVYGICNSYSTSGRVITVLYTIARWLIYITIVVVVTICVTNVFNFQLGKKANMAGENRLQRKRKSTIRKTYVQNLRESLKWMIDG